MSDSMSDSGDQRVGEEAAAYEPSADDYFQAKEAGFSDPQAQFLLRRFGQPGPDPTTIAMLSQIQSRLDRIDARLDQQQEINVEILSRLSRLEAQREADREQYLRDREQYERNREADREQYERDREADREQYLRDREADREQYLSDREADRKQYLRDREADQLERQRDREEFLRQIAELRGDIRELRQDLRSMDERLVAVETGLAELRADVKHLQDRTLFENRVWRAVVGLSVAAGAAIGGVLAFWK